MFFKKRKIIGRLEYVDVPTLNLFKISAKIDTGAYRGSVHATNIEEIVKNGKKVLIFNLFNTSYPGYKEQKFEFKDYKIHQFRGTKVCYHSRYVIPVEIIIAGEKIQAELSLTDRKDLRHPILIGRRALKNKFLIDVNKKY